jgi:hypothetical protein
VARSVVERARPALCSRPEDSRMDGRGRMSDNIFIQRLWRTVKYEEDYLKDYKDVLEAKKKETEGLWELTPLTEIRSQRGFPQRLGKHKTLSTIPTRPDGGSTTPTEFNSRKRGHF